MPATNYLLAVAFVLTSIWAHPWPEHVPHECDVGKICSWGFGQVYTISESRPNVSSEGRLFQVSQKVKDHHNDEKSHCTPTDRVYTIINLEFSGLGGDGCSLVFNVPCNNTTPLYHHGPIDIAAKALRYLPSTNPTWNNIVNANPPVIVDNVLGTFSDIHLGARDFITTHACSSGPISNLAFIFQTADSVHRTAELKFNQTLMNEDIVTGVYVNFTC